MARLFVHGMKLCKELVEAMNIPRPIRSITINSDCSKPVSVTVEFVPTVEDTDKITKIMGQYRLVGIESE